MKEKENSMKNILEKQEKKQKKNDGVNSLKNSHKDFLGSVKKPLKRIMIILIVYLD